MRSPAPARSSEAVRAAQRAFFEAALNGQAAVRPSAQPAAAAPAAGVPAVRTTLATVVDAASPPSRLLRPGSLLDIRV